MSVKQFIKHIYVFICRMWFGINKEKIVFQSFSGKSYSDNPKAISEKLYEINPNLSLVWVLNNSTAQKDVIPNYIKIVDASDKLKLFKELATCAVYIDNSCLPCVPKGKNQFFVQTWHGDRGFKKVLHDSGYRTTKQRVNEEKSGYCDLAIAGSDYGERQYRSAFGYKGKILKVGTPRNDILVNPNTKILDEIKAKLCIQQDSKILLYAPTLREASALSYTLQDIQNIDISATLKCLERKFNCEWICFIRAHSAVSGISGIVYNDKVWDVSSYPDMAELLLITDMLITDYSSSAGDFPLLNKPIILYQADRNTYENNDRGFYFDVDKSPYYIAKTQQELENLISDLDNDKVKNNCKEILEFYNTYESGKASEEVAKIILMHISKL